MKSHGPYAMKFFFCEFLCLINVIGQMYFTDRFTSSLFASLINIVIFNNPLGSGGLLKLKKTMLQAYYYLNTLQACSNYIENLTTGLSQMSHVTLTCHLHI